MLIELHRRLSARTSFPCEKLPKLAWLFMLLFATIAPTRVHAMGADANGDGRYDIRDVQRIVQLILATAQPTYPMQGDANGDGLIDAADVQAVVGLVIAQPSPLRLAGPLHLPRATTNRQYAVWLPAAGGTPPYAWSYSGSLPPGYSLSAEGWLIGFPTLVDTYSLPLTLTDSASNLLSLVLQLEVRVPNQPPNAQPDSFQFVNQIAAMVPAPGVLANDSDADGDTITAVLVSQPSHGSLALHPDGSFDYLVHSPISVSDSFIYRAFDGLEFSQPVTVTIDNQHVPGPVAIDDDYLVQVGQSLTIAAPGVLSNDTSPGLLEANLHSQALNGTVVLALNGGFTYTPMPGFTGEDEFVYRVSYLTLESFATVRVLVHMAGQAGDPFLSSYFVQNPVQSGFAATLRARLWAGVNNLPGSHVVQSISVVTPWSQLPVAMTLLAASTSPRVAIFEASLATTGAQFGIHTFVVTANLHGNQTLTDEATLAIYLGTPIRVGPTRIHQSIAAVAGTQQQERCILIDPGEYSGVNNTDLTINRIMLAGDRGLHRTRIMLTTGSFVVGQGTPGAIIIGLDIIPAVKAALVLDEAAIVLQCRIRDGYVSDTVLSEGTGIIATGASLVVRECWFRDNLLGNGTNGSAGGASIHALCQSLMIQRSTFWRNLTISEELSNGGAIFIESNTVYTASSTAVVDACWFAQNQSLSVLQSNGGAIAAVRGVALDVTRSTFIGNDALAGPYAGIGVAEPTETNNTANGGAVYLNQSSLRTSNCKFMGCTAIATSFATGGGVSSATSYGTHWPVLMHMCNVDECLAFAESARGGGVHLQLVISRMEHIQIQNCEVDGPNGRTSSHIGGGIANLHGRISMFNCSIRSNFAGRGGGIWSILSSHQLHADQCRFEDNLAEAQSGAAGGGLGMSSANLYAITILNSVFERNTVVSPAGGVGGAVALNMWNPHNQVTTSFYNCLFIENSVPNGEGGVLGSFTAFKSAEVHWLNCTFAGNTASSGGLFAPDVTHMRIRNCIVASSNSTPIAGNSGVSHSSCVPLGSPFWATDPANGNITADPLFATGPRGNHYLAVGSPCRAAGLWPVPSGLLTGLTARPNEQLYTLPPDLGYHYLPSTSPVIPRSPNPIPGLPPMLIAP